MQRSPQGRQRSFRGRPERSTPKVMLTLVTLARTYNHNNDDMDYGSNDKSVNLSVILMIPITHCLVSIGFHHNMHLFVPYYLFFIINISVRVNRAK